ncbi:hypothetical protein [Actinomadura sp. 9N407]|uniref:hypothetical protein n=1 Tax=Actinomadura sp. 9N407 TaxID=3375154 RepID=UPI0037B5EF83
MIVTPLTAPERGFQVFPRRTPPNAVHHRIRAHAHAGDPDATPHNLLVIGAHGGAGTSTLAALLDPAHDLGTVDRLSDADRSRLQTQGPVAIVARNTVAAAWHATRAVTAVAATCQETGGHIAALVIVSDGAGSEPREATARFGLLQGRVRGLVRMSFVPMLRLVDDPTTVMLPAKARDALETVLELAFSRPCH